MHESFAAALAARVRRRGGDPLVTYVDAASGERTELSATSLSNAAAKIGNALLGEFDLAAGDVLGLQLPPHWQFASWCAGGWTAGCVVAPGVSVDTDLVVTDMALAASCTPARDGIQVVSMHPFGLPITEQLAAGCHDVTIAVRQQPDALLYPPAQTSDAALQFGDERVTQAALLEHARELAAQWNLGPGGRLLVPGDLDPVTAAYACIAVPVACDASAVIVHSADADSRARIASHERTTTSAAPSR